MTTTRRSHKTWAIVGAVIAAVAVLAGVAFAAGVGPFQQNADVEAGHVCSTLGSGKAAAGSLREILPDAEQYAFTADDPQRRDRSDPGFSSSCFVRGNDMTLLSVRTTMARTGTGEGWLEGEVRPDYEAGEKAGEVAFDAGGTAVATPHRAAIRFPCVPEGEIPGGSRSLRVVARLGVDADSPAGDAATRQALAELALGAARHAHERANCELPSKLPRKSPQLGGGG